MKSIGHNILAVVDDTDALAKLRDMLKPDGYCVTGDSTLKDIADRHPWSEFSIILLDCQLPEGFADTILPHLHETAPHAAVIVIAGQTDLNGTIAAIRSGRADYVLKPINPDLLRAAIARVLKMQEMMERTLQAERLAAFSELLQTAPDAMLRIDAEGRILLMNEEAERMFGYRKEELLAQHVEILLSEPLREAHVRYRRQFFEHPMTRPMGTRQNLLVRRKDGSELPVDICLGHRRVNGQDHVIASVRDITERRRLEESLRHSTEAVKHAYECIRRDVEAAAQLQRNLLPAELPSAAGIQCAWEYRPCAGLGGDGLNIFRLDDDHIGFYLLDVSGHGVAAALLSVTLARLLSPALSQSSLLHTPQPAGQGYQTVPPAEVARRLNQWLMANPAGEQYFTILYGILEVHTRFLRFVSAGHPALLYAPANSEPTLLRVPGFPIGCVEDADFEETTLQLHPGDRLFIYSDGLSEATGSTGEQFGVARLQRLIAAAPGERIKVCTQRLVREVLQWAGDAPQDDLSVLALAVE